MKWEENTSESKFGCSGRCGRTCSDDSGEDAVVRLFQGNDDATPLNGTIITTPATPATAINLGGFGDGDLITKRELAKCLGCSERTLQRLVERYEIPPPTSLGGRKVWIVGKLLAWIADAADRKEAEALKEARRLRVFDA